jgi:hypothetical protein
MRNTCLSLFIFLALIIRARYTNYEAQRYVIFPTALLDHLQYIPRSYSVLRPEHPFTQSERRRCYYYYYYYFITIIIIVVGHAVAYLVEALCYKPEGRGFESR